MQKNRRSGEMDNRLFETYTNFVVLHGKNIPQKASDMAMEKMCAYPS